MFLDGGWKKCNAPRWFDEYRLRCRVGYPESFSIKGRTFRYKAFKEHDESQGDTLITIYQFYKKRRGYRIEYTNGRKTYIT